MATVIKINGEVHVGKSLRIKEGRVSIDGQVVELGEVPAINIEVTGDVSEIRADTCDSITVRGSAGDISTMSGDVKCDDVSGSVKTMSGDVHCGNVAGNVSTMSGSVYTSER
uniref:hypothetical protein n=1 Tax=Cupriavidus gilardii TaxID=82541 RepID=UPI0024799F70|nr:hypothetical protein [Cupriavidus gilardii]WDE72699.1 hypothetical protein [Cupriavidus gilardii]